MMQTNPGNPQLEKRRAYFMAKAYKALQTDKLYQRGITNHMIKSEYRKGFNVSKKWF